MHFHRRARRNCKVAYMQGVKLDSRRFDPRERIEISIRCNSEFLQQPRPACPHALRAAFSIGIVPAVAPPSMNLHGGHRFAPFATLLRVVSGSIAGTLIIVDGQGSKDLKRNPRTRYAVSLPCIAASESYRRRLSWSRAHVKNLNSP